MRKLSDFFGGGTSISNYDRVDYFEFLESGEWIAPKDGVILLFALGAGGTGGTLFTAGSTIISSEKGGWELTLFGGESLSGGHATLGESMIVGNYTEQNNKIGRSIFASDAPNGSEYNLASRLTATRGSGLGRSSGQSVYLSGLFGGKGAGYNASATSAGSGGDAANFLEIAVTDGESILIEIGASSTQGNSGYCSIQFFYDET